MNNRKDCLSALIGSMELWGGIGQVGSSGWEHLQVIDRIDRFGDYSNPGHLYYIIETERVCNLKIFLSGNQCNACQWRTPPLWKPM